jgi:ubiquinone/menaquinone biosynthesis C-methylase UbiE
MNEPRTIHGRAHQRIHAWLLIRENPRSALFTDARKQALFGELQGTIVELGPGAGHNFRFFPPKTHWIGIEPNPYLHPHLRQQANRAGIPAEVRSGWAEDIPPSAGTADGVVGTFVLCSVSDPQRVLGEILRVLKPGGTFAFIEHVAAPRETGMRVVRRMITPIWKVIADGCHPDRETWHYLEEAGFEELKIDHFKLSVSFIAPHIAGTGKKPRSQVA